MSHPNSGFAPTSSMIKCSSSHPSSATISARQSMMYLQQTHR